ncbi:TIGR04206 family protein [haloarchaeon 3A1-DGR]|nr:TIGR04206 family protein [haloarchaeon 3A1-DGR]
MTDARPDRNGADADGSATADPRSDGIRIEDSGSEDLRIDDRAALAAAVGLLAVPVTVIVDGDAYTIVSLWGLVTVAPGPGGETVVSGYPLWRYLLDHPLSFGALPASIRAWPLALAFHLLAIGSVGTGVLWDREDRRVTGGLLVLAGIASLSVALGIGSRYGLGTPSAVGTVVPVAAICAWACAIALYGPALRGILGR